MSLERRDVRAKLDPDMFDALNAILEAKGIAQGEFIEALLVPEIKRLVHEANLISERLRGTGIDGNNREKPGTAGKLRKWILIEPDGRRSDFSENPLEPTRR